MQTRPYFYDVELKRYELKREWFIHTLRPQSKLLIELVFIKP